MNLSKLDGDTPSQSADDPTLPDRHGQAYPSWGTGYYREKEARSKKPGARIKEGISRSQAPLGNGLKARLCLAARAKDLALPLEGVRRSLSCSAFPGGAWERGCVALLHNGFFGFAGEFVAGELALGAFEGDGPVLICPEVDGVFSGVFHSFIPGHVLFHVAVGELFLLHEGFGFGHGHAGLEVLVEHGFHLGRIDVLCEMAGHGADSVTAGEEAGEE